jgi:predicted metal-binding protein
MRDREGAFEQYRDEEIELVGYTTCEGCPGGNVEYVPAEMKRNGAEVIHLATGLLVGYPPCPYIDDFQRFIEEKYGVPIVVGTHPIPEKYYKTHSALGTWEAQGWKEFLLPTLADEKTRLAYD